MIDRDYGSVEPSELFLVTARKWLLVLRSWLPVKDSPNCGRAQALVSPTSYASPRRSTTGIDYNRLLQILAVLENDGIPYQN